MAGINNFLSDVQSRKKYLIEQRDEIDQEIINLGHIKRALKQDQSLKKISARLDEEINYLTKTEKILAEIIEEQNASKYSYDATNIKLAEEYKKLAERHQELDSSFEIVIDNYEDLKEELEKITSSSNSTTTTKALGSEIINTFLEKLGQEMSITIEEKLAALEVELNEKIKTTEELKVTLQLELEVINEQKLKTQATLESAKRTEDEAGQVLISANRKFIAANEELGEACRMSGKKLITSLKQALARLGKKLKESVVTIKELNSEVEKLRSENKKINKTNDDLTRDLKISQNLVKIHETKNKA